MAANSPVVLDSSSPPPTFRHPSITPPKSAEANVSSSPGLPELSVFFKSNATARAAAPKTASAFPGFTSAGTIWKAAALEAEQNSEESRRDGSVEKSTAPERRSPRRLVRPEKKAQTGKGAGTRTRTPSISVSDFDFKQDESPGQMQPPQATKKLGKRAVRPEGGDGIVKVGKAVGKGKDSQETMPKPLRRAVKSISFTSNLGFPDTAAWRKLGSISPAHSDPAQTVAKSAGLGTSWRPSISISDSNYDDGRLAVGKEAAGEKAAEEKDEQTSAYFCTSASNAPRSPKNRAVEGSEVARGGNSTDRTLSYKATASFEAIPTITAAPAKKMVILPEESGRSPVVYLPQVNHRLDDHYAAFETTLSKPETVKKPRKRATHAKTATHAVSAKKPRKKFAKSASIILNSDEPDPAVGDSSHASDNRRPSVEDIQAAAYAPKAKKVHKSAKLIFEEELDAESGFGIWSQSAYFNSVSVTKTIESHRTVESMQTVFPADVDAQIAPQESGFAALPDTPRPQTSFSRRRSWTPAKNTYDTLDPEVESSGESPAPRTSLADLVGGFTYDEQVPSRQQRSPPCEPLLKKRRIEIEEDSAALPAAQKIKGVKEKVKRVKAPKRKPQTITDLATKAYRVEEETISNAQATVSEFFTAQKDDHTSAPPPFLTDSGEIPLTFKKPRKPRAKRVDGEAATAKKTPKPKKVKLKFSEAPALLSPQQARAKEQRQGFLFGTSSQLALEEDVDYVRDLQMAIMESEAVGDTPSSPRQVLTKVSVGNTERRLFWSASRDSWGHVIAANGVRRKGAVAACGQVAALRKVAAQPSITVKPVEVGHRPLPRTTATDQENAQDQDSGTLQPEDGQVVDLCGTSPIGATGDYGNMPDAVKLQLETVSPEPVFETTASAPAATGIDDSWALLNSGESDADKPLEAFWAPTTACNQISDSRPAEITTSQRQHYITSPRRSLPHRREALTNLDSNIAILSHAYPTRQWRGFSQTSQANLKSPRKGPSKESAAALSPKRRGRPPKSASPEKFNDREQPACSAHQHSLSSDFVAIDDISDSASDDLPLKEVLAGKTAITSPKRRGRPPKASQQSPITSTSKSSFVKLDDISDSDAGMKTPSPRRRKAGVLNPVRTLELSPSASEDPGLPPMADGKAAVKPSDACWLPVTKVLFPQISAVIMSTKPCGDSGQLSWWEKILMYDPIVLEDLTAWLAGRGVGVQLRRKLVKEKKKGRKKKGEIVEEEEELQVEEFEVVEEELKGWMVQKWCEEKSICCLWREGLRGGVRVRY